MRITLLVLLICMGRTAFGQTGLIFDGTDYPAYSTPWGWGQSTIELEEGSGIDGANAIKWIQGDEWGGGWTGIGFTVDPPFNLNDVWQTESATLMLKCEEGTGDLRIQYEDGTGKVGTVFTPIADNEWHEYTFPLNEMELQDNTTEFNPSNVTTVGIMAQESGIVGKTLYITNWYITTEQTLILFNGITMPTNVESWIWGNSTFDLVTGGGPSTGTNALKWVQADGETGFGFTIDPLHDLSEVWDTDSMKFKMKVEEGIDTMTFMFYDVNYVIIRTNLVPITDNQWHEYAIPLNEFQNLADSSVFDRTQINFVEVNTGLHAGGGVAGKTVYFTDWWTGNPSFDVMPPNLPATFNVTPESFQNKITWADVAGEERERYNLYYSTNPITDVSQAEVVELRVKDNIQEYTHMLRAPVSDQEISYYYAITCTDGSGNTSEPLALGSAVTNTAKGVPTLSLNAPAAFNPDGDISEWSAITPIHMAPGNGGYVVDGTAITDDADLSLDAYLAVDNTYLYVAFEVEDDVVVTSGATWANDCPDLYLGLYDWHGAPHNSLERGANPDYHFRFSFDRVLIDGLPDGDSLLIPGADYYWGEKFPSGYTVEARIPWTALAEKTGDEVFTPVEGMRIPIDFDIIDSEVADSREGILCYSPKNNANSWSSPYYWTYTWIGNKSTVGVNDIPSVALKYNLDQNYPNPFNPTTQIKYTIEKEGLVSLKVFDMLGREVKELIHQQQNPGNYTVNFNASGLSSGMYVYKITAGDFQISKKMMLLK